MSDPKKPEIRLALAALFMAARIVRGQIGTREELVAGSLADADELAVQFAKGLPAEPPA